jgi:hypothetical protein
MRSRKQEAAVSLLTWPTVFVAAIAAIVYVAVSLSKLESGQNSMNEKLDGLNEKLDGLNEKHDGLRVEMKAGLAEVKDAVREMSNVLAGVHQQGAQPGARHP